VVIDRAPFAIEVPAETVTAKSDGAVTVGARIEGHVVDPVAAAVNVADYEDATRMIARTAIHALMKDRPASDLMSARAELEVALARSVDDGVRSWGVVVSSATLHATDR
jgi:SPFH domain / Band 7 family